MKRQLLFLFFLVCSFAGNAQNTFAPVGAEWHHFGSYYSMDGWGEQRYTLFRSRVTGDTIIAGIQCRKIEQTALGKNIINGFNNTAHTQKDSIALRPLYVYDNTDTVFIYNDNFGKFTPLYIFNANEGDTLCLPVIPNDYGTSNLLFHPISGDTSFCLVIDSIRNIVYDTTTLRTFYSHFLSDLGMEYSDNVPIYNWSPYYYTNARKGVYAERIGGVRSTLLPTTIGNGVEKPTMVIHTAGLGFRCYSDTVYHINVSEGECDFFPPDVLSILEKINQNDISLFPNPSSGAFFLQSNTAFAAKTTVTLFDNLGRVIQSLPSPSGKTRMHYILEGIVPGVYFLKIEENGQSVQKKITITH